MTATPRWPRALLLTLLLLAVALAGCAGGDEVEPDADGDNGGAADDGATSGDDGSGGSPTSPTPADAREAAAHRVAAELERLGAEPGHFLMTVETTETSRPQVTTQSLFVDSANETSVYRLLTTGGATSGEDQLVGQVAHTTFVGRLNTTVFAARNDTLAPFSTPDALAQIVGSSKLPGAFLAYYGTPRAVLLQAGHVGSYTATTVDDVTHAGSAAQRIVFGSLSGTHSEFIVEKGTSRILALSVAQSMGGSVKWTNGTFAYGADARSEVADALVRGEAMTFLDPPTLRAAQLESDPQKNVTWTVRASEKGARVALADVELRLYSQSGPESSQPRLVVEVADGEGENADASLAYVDVDGDGHVSEGDTFTLTTLRDRDDAYDFRVRLVDTTTDLSLGDR